MKATDALVAWNPGGEVDVLNWPDFSGASDRFVFTGGAAYSYWRRAKGDALRAALFTEFNTMVVRDRIDPQAAHKAFLKIEEYRLWIAPDMQGADSEPGELGGGLG